MTCRVAQPRKSYLLYNPLFILLRLMSVPGQNPALKKHEVVYLTQNNILFQIIVVILLVILVFLGVIILRGVEKMSSDTRYIYDILQRNNRPQHPQPGYQRQQWLEVINKVRNIEEMMTMNLKTQGQQQHQKCGRYRHGGQSEGDMGNTRREYVGRHGRGRSEL